MILEHNCRRNATDSDSRTAAYKSGSATMGGSPAIWMSLVPRSGFFRDELLEPSLKSSFYFFGERTFDVNKMAIRFSFVDPADGVKTKIPSISFGI